MIFVDTAPGTTPIGLAFSHAAGRSRQGIDRGGTGRQLPARTGPAGLQPSGKHGNRSRCRHGSGINKYHPRSSMSANRWGFRIQYGAMPQRFHHSQFTGFARQLNPGNREAAPLVEVEPSSVGAAAIFDVAKSLIRSFHITQPGLPAAE